MALLQLRPDLPLCWESPDSLRIGFEHATARVPHPSAAQQRLLGRLRDGIPADSWAAQTRAVGATPREARELLGLIGPALTRSEEEPDPSVSRPLRVLLSDDGRPVPGFHEALQSSGACAIGDASAAPEVVVYLERFLEPLERAQGWLRADLPHLLVRFTDTRVFVGPLVEPPGAPCHTCATLASLERDPALAMLAAQLVGVRPASETRVLGAAAAATAACFLTEWRQGPPGSHRTQIAIPVSNGRPAGAAEVTVIQPHPECACGTELDADTGPGPGPGTGSNSGTGADSPSATK